MLFSVPTKATVRAKSLYLHFILKQAENIYTKGVYILNDRLSAYLTRLRGKINVE